MATFRMNAMNGVKGQFTNGVYTETVTEDGASLKFTLTPTKGQFGDVGEFKAGTTAPYESLTFLHYSADCFTLEFSDPTTGESKPITGAVTFVYIPTGGSSIGEAAGGISVDRKVGENISKIKVDAYIPRDESIVDILSIIVQEL